MEKATLVAGAGISGIGAARLLHDAGEPVILYDSNASLSHEALTERLGFEGCEYALGDLTDEVIARAKECVISPGIDPETLFVVRLREAGVPITSEIELAYRYAKGKLIAITGTNGKTTTTALVGQIMANAFPSAFTVGNIGTAYTAKALETTDETVTTAECSSFQLEAIRDFHPQVSAILNITPDHLNRHHTMEEYARVKELVTKNQGPEDACVLNFEDDRLRAFGESLNGRVKVVWFSSQRVLEDGLFVQDGFIRLAQGGQVTDVIRTDELNILGTHNHENVCAAVGCALSMGVSMDIIRQTLKAFQAVPHRIEFVGEKSGVKYYNDSKGTNVDAAIRGIRAMSVPTVLIGGGYDKGATYDEWFDAFDGKVKLLILIGQTREKIAACAEAHGFADYRFAESLEEAVEIAAAAAQPGWAVLLSPACASWGMFKNYEERGDIFRALVQQR